LIFLFDLDGTISFDGQSIERSIVESIKELEQKGNEVIFTSARPIRDMLPLLKSNFEDNFYIGGNGSIIKDRHIIKVTKRMDTFSVIYLKELIKKYNLDYLVDDEWNYSLRNRYDRISKINDKIDVLKVARNISINEIQRPIKFTLLNIPLKNYDQIYKKIRKLPVEIMRHEGTYNIDITAKNINKYTIFRKYFPNEKYIAFGNDENDLAMLQNSDVAIVVGNKTLMQNHGFKNIDDTVHQVAEIIVKYGNNNT